ncbi:unnamed protein product [Arabis nemorensis]|uniref:Peptidase S8/S53 domain-containing protein n=1 Tax=Arabis nemorensis TaxID=586526 RepID=A0A565BUP4_9BRAS|nr:unnamed protein product [Arabis nemorensis]
MVTGARVATYKACWNEDYYVSLDILAAIDKAIEDNVNILSISIEFGTLDYQSDDITIGALPATKRDIIVYAAAGNHGPRDSNLVNLSSWITKVGVRTIDWKFSAIVVLGNHKTFPGVSTLFKIRALPNKQFPLVYGLLGGNVTGELVFVDMGLSGNDDIKTATRSACGIIFANTIGDGREFIAQFGLFLSTIFGKLFGDQIWEYILSKSNLKVAVQFKGTVLNVNLSSIVASFSSRGPLISPEIMKSDIIALGC